MIDHASIAMSLGKAIASEYAQGMNDNMSYSHFHDFFELYFLEAGERYHMIRDKLYLLKAGEFVLFPPRVMHHSYGADNVFFKRILLYFQPEQVSSRRMLEHFSGEALICSVDSSTRFGIHRMMETLFEEQENGGLCSEEYMQTTLNLLLLTIMRKAQPVETIKEKNIMADVIQYLYDHYAEDITIENLSQAFYLSPYYLCRKFKETTGSTIIRYLNTTRILNAQRMMLETGKNFTQISKETGFSNLTHFNRVFKSVTGMTPSENRRRNEGKKQGGTKWQAGEAASRPARMP